MLLTRRPDVAAVAAPVPLPSAAFLETEGGALASVATAPPLFGVCVYRSAFAPGRLFSASLRSAVAADRRWFPLVAAPPLLVPFRRRRCFLHLSAAL